jgi:hypothetical protein
MALLRVGDAMLLDFHHVPGRLRVALGGLKRNAQAAAPLRQALLAVPGVKSAAITMATGSVIIHYERDLLGLEDFWAILRSHGHLCDVREARSAVWIDPTHPVAVAVADALGREIVSMMLHRCLGPTGGALARLLI